MTGQTLSKLRLAFIIFWILLLCAEGLSQTVEQTENEFLGIRMHPEIQAMMREIERKSGMEIYARFIKQKEFMLGSSYISEEGEPVILIDKNLENGDDKKLEAVVVHELLHLRLRVNGFPTFLFSSSINMSKGRAVDTEQDNLNDLTSLIEHQIFKSDMEKFDLYKYINLAGDTAAAARKDKGKEDGQADVINYIRAILEYPNTKDVEEVRRIYAENKWTRALREGMAIADLISRTNPQSPKEVETLFVKCLAILYPLPNSAYAFKLTLEPDKKVFRRMVVNISKKFVQPKKR